MRHENFRTMSAYGKALIIDLMSQFNGRNNGDLCAAFSVLKERGWRSKGTLGRAIKELKDRQWIVVARQGGRNHCSLYALTFQAIDECKGKLDILSTRVASGGWKN